MANVLDLTTLQQPTLDLTLFDPKHKKVQIHVTIPGTDMVREFQAADDSMNSVLSSGSKAGIEAAYELVARILSYNMEGITFTPEDLQSKDKWNINLYGAIAIYKAYTKFIHELEKN